MMVIMTKDDNNNDNNNNNVIMILIVVMLVPVFKKRKKLKLQNTSLASKNGCSNQTRRQYNSCQKLAENSQLLLLAKERNFSEEN